jgi:hypothetical protein
LDQTYSSYELGNLTISRGGSGSLDRTISGSPPDLPEVPKAGYQWPVITPGVRRKRAS